MKVVILAGGFGTRIAEESGTRPKPMVEIGGHPILWHVMKIYSAYGIKDFIICAGYKSEVIKNFFANYLLQKSDITFDTKNGTTTIERNGVEDWKVTVVDTGQDSMTGGRLARVKKYIGNETFMMTYGDGVGDINIKELIDFHKKEGVLATVTAVKTPGRFGAFILDPGQTKVQHFREKESDDGTRINAGFFVLEPEVFNYIKDDQTVWEQEPLQQLSKEGKLAGFRHNGFWQPMDSLRDKNLLEEIWGKGNASWKVW
ncbi:MAG: glucose-1-phosphate cytidylyltransferase [bacterium]|nr:glucose-1-phosphate cytidylyltransferase [bacterium]